MNSDSIPSCLPRSIASRCPVPPIVPHKCEAEAGEDVNLAVASSDKDGKLDLAAMVWLKYFISASKKKTPLSFQIKFLMVRIASKFLFSTITSLI